MNTRGFQQYKEQALSLEALKAMTPGQLLNLLLDELVKRLLRAELALEQKNYEQFEACVDRCIAIVWYLDDTLDVRYEIGQQLRKLYFFFQYDLSRIKYGRNADELQKLKPLILDLRDSFRAAEQNERSSAGGGQA